MDIDLADSTKATAILAHAVNGDCSTAGPAAVLHIEMSDKVSKAENSLPFPLLWECLHRQCSPETIAKLMQCKVEMPPWPVHKSEPVCAADKRIEQYSEHPPTGQDSRSVDVTLLRGCVLLLAAQVLLLVLVWRWWRQFVPSALVHHMDATAKNEEQQVAGLSSSKGKPFRPDASTVPVRSTASQGEISL